MSRSGQQDDDEELRRAAIDRLPTYDSLRKGMLNRELDDGKIMQGEVNVTKLGNQEKKLLMDSVLKTAEEDNERFLERLRERTDRRFNVGEDCPVFDGLFPFCQAAAALPSHALPLITNDGGATITNDAFPHPPACHQRRQRILSTALPRSRSSSSPPRSLSSCPVGAAVKLNRQDADIAGLSPPSTPPRERPETGSAIIVVSEFIDGAEQDDDRIRGYVWWWSLEWRWRWWRDGGGGGVVVAVIVVVVMVVATLWWWWRRGGDASLVVVVVVVVVEVVWAEGFEKLAVWRFGRCNGETLTPSPFPCAAYLVGVAGRLLSQPSPSPSTQLLVLFFAAAAVLCRRR
ncbi:hypothetical protein RHGRI_005617 [Rhododendron griersonianum]|uniref:Uncharacterized protein n=1 Tax=Rhododendron griersonianum TaxID=479676 RepID=A0AAV6LE79_9ERIC|nr:hypothetical protein RHGRI_005617 [Rhododendron griersonianum]